MRHNLNPFITLVVLLPLVGCGTTSPDLITAIRNVDTTIPEEVFDECPDLPIVPNPDTATELDVARFTVESFTGMKACKEVVDTIRNLQDGIQDDSDDGTRRQDETPEEQNTNRFPFFTS